MKKTLAIATLLGALNATAPANATEHWAKGVTFDKTTKMATGAYTSYKHNAVSGDDSELCWAASAANLIAWWQDRTEENGAIIIPNGTPRGYAVWETVRTLWDNRGGWAPGAIQYWMHGNTISCGYGALTSAGYAFTGYYNRISGAEFGIGNYHDYSDFEPDGALISTYSIPSHDFAGASKWLADGFDKGDVFAFATDAHVMTVYGVNYNESTGKVSDFYWTDNNNTSAPVYPQNRLIAGEAWDNGTDGAYFYVYGAGSKLVRYLYGIHTTGIHFTDYDVVRNAGRKDEMFSHYCNIIMEDGESFELEYDLRDANAEGSPVLPYVYTYDGNEVKEKKHITTGDVFLRNGSLSLVNCAEGREKLDGGGAVSGSIVFEDTEQAGATRTLSVQRTATIAKEIKIAAANSNELEVTGSNTASFGSLTGEGNLDKTGTGTAEVTESVSLKGAVNVKNGRFVFGESATLGGETVLNVFSTGQVESKSGSSATLTLDAGIHTNDGAITLTTTVNTGATLKGSGTFADVTVDGGTLIVGNSPGQQTYTGDLAVTLGDIVFSVDGWNAADGNNSGWGRGVYSNINMGNNDLTLGADSRICINLSNNALTELISGQEGNFSMDIVTGIDNVGVFDSVLLEQLALQTHFFAAGEEGASTGALAAGSSLDSYLRNMQYSMNGGVLTLKGSYGSASSVPEPATGTLSLLALAALCARRRRK